ncbi:hypothetical protein OIE91_11270 [Streptomyces albidoflavus]|uniref:hypothetical protein n=1 Tax=Streptomyces TaxID=1883 RepID=UPI0002830E8A|nr:hypothetical protein [Streptomyces sp. SM8]
MSTDRNLLRAFEAMAADALRSVPPVAVVTLDTERGREMVFHPAGEDDRLCGGGTLIIPADTAENRRRWAVTRGCPRCPDINQGLMSQEHDLGPEAGTYVTAVYGECGHGATIRLDGDEEPHVFPVGA